MEKKIANLRKEATVCCLQKVNESLQEAAEGGGMGWGRRRPERRRSIILAGGSE